MKEVHRTGKGNALSDKCHPPKFDHCAV